MGYSPWGHTESDTTEYFLLLPTDQGSNLCLLAVEAWSLKRWAAGEVSNLNTSLILKKCPAEGRSLTRRHNHGQQVT